MRTEVKFTRKRRKTAPISEKLFREVHAKDDLTEFDLETLAGYLIVLEKLHFK